MFSKIKVLFFIIMLSYIFSACALDVTDSSSTEEKPIETTLPEPTNISSQIPNFEIPQTAKPISLQDFYALTEGYWQKQDDSINVCFYIYHDDYFVDIVSWQPEVNIQHNYFEVDEMFIEGDLCFLKLFYIHDGQPANVAMTINLATIEFDEIDVEIFSLDHTFARKTAVYTKTSDPVHLIDQSFNITGLSNLEYEVSILKDGRSYCFEIKNMETKETYFSEMFSDYNETHYLINDNIYVVTADNIFCLAFDTAKLIPKLEYANTSNERIILAHYYDESKSKFIFANLEKAVANTSDGDQEIPVYVDVYDENLILLNRYETPKHVFHNAMGYTGVDILIEDGTISIKSDWVEDIPWQQVY